jgi:lipopolysaccharide biosynthesis regulator YciM
LAGISVAVALGALALAVALVVSDLLRRRREEARAYLRGVRSMLSDDPDAAIEALSDGARLGSPGAVETYLALGALFRRTGDLSRAVRLHRNMLLGPGLDRARRPEVERELAEDYRASGMLAEAADLYGRLASAGDRAAAEGLRDVLVEGGQIGRAVEVHRGLASPGATDAVLAHLLAALAREARGGDLAAARAAAGEAVRAHPGSADALLALAEVSGASGDGDSALSAAARALEADPRAALLAGPAFDAVPSAPAALEFVEGRLARAPDDAGLHLLRGRTLQRLGRGAEAVAALHRALEVDRSGEAALALRELLGDAEAPRPLDLADRHALLLAAVTRPARRLVCARCGSEAAALAWRCRRCGAFDAFPGEALKPGGACVPAPGPV